MPARPPRRGRLRARVELSLAAFAPSFGLMVWRAWGGPLAWLFGVVALFGFAVFLVVLRATRTGNPEPFNFGDITDSSADVLGHVGSYLAVAIIDPKASEAEAVLAIAVFSLVFLIHVSVGLVHVNPLFYLVGYRVYSGISTAGNTYYLIAHTDVAEWDGPQRLIRMLDGILIESRKHAPR